MPRLKELSRQSAVVRVDIRRLFSESLNPYEACVLLVLSSFRGAGGIASVSIPEIAESLRISTRTVERVIKSMNGRGVIKTAPSPGLRNKYTLSNKKKL